MENKSTYLGDGLYCFFEHGQFELRANNPDNPTDTVYLDGSVFKNFLRFAEKIYNVKIQIKKNKIEEESNGN